MTVHDAVRRYENGGTPVSQMHLLRERRFSAFFWTQFLGALNDNLFKNALAILIVFRSLSVAGLDPSEVVVMSAGVFILPFVLFSAFAGQLADRFRKPPLVRWVKLAEIVLMAIAAVGLALGDLRLLLFVLFLMGAQSSFFGPVKYSILPQLLHKDELVGGNALVETGTFLAILLGTIFGGVLISVPGYGVYLVAGTVLIVAVAGFLASLRVPPLPAENPTLAISLNPITPLRETVRVTSANRTVFLSILGIAWFWFFGGCFIALLPDYGKSVLHGGEHVVTLLLALFCVGTAVGSLLCERLSGRTVELGVVPIGSLGMSLAALDLFLAGTPEAVGGPLLGVGGFIGVPSSWRIMFDFVLIAVFGGLYIVPLYTLVQQRSEAAYRSRVIAGSNIMGALFMVASSIMLMALLRAGLEIPQIFLVLSLMNIAVAFYIYQTIPEFLFRFAAWVVANIMYRLRVVGLDNVPQEGAALLVCNHVSFVDWLFVASACERPPRFVMYHGFRDMRFVSWMFRDAKVIPIAPAHESEDTLVEAFERIAVELENGNLVCIFPEGKLTRDGEINVFRTGVERILERTPVPVVPMALKGMWGSFFSRKDGKTLRRPFRRIWSRVSLVIGPAVAAEEADAVSLSHRVARLADMTPPPSLGGAQAVVEGN